MEAAGPVPAREGVRNVQRSKDRPRCRGGVPGALVVDSIELLLGATHRARGSSGGLLHAGRVPAPPAQGNKAQGARPLSLYRAKPTRRPHVTLDTLGW